MADSGTSGPRTTHDRNSAPVAAGTDRADAPTQRAPRATLSEMAGHTIQGMLMGTADVIPGVSGGTVALILGIYERLVDTIHHVAAAGVALAKVDRAQARVHWRRAELALLLPLAMGIAVALGIGTLTLPHLIETYPVVTSAVFFGLIAGALPIPWRRMSVHRGKHYALALAGSVAAFAIAGFAPQDVSDPALPAVFAAAAVAICAMILPGVSGAYLLLVMGLYETTLRAVGDLNIVYVGVFGAGAVTGLAMFSKLLSWLLDHRHDATMAVLVGLMAGSLRRLWPWQSDAGALAAPPDGPALVLATVCVLIGVVAVIALTRIGERTTTPAGEAHAKR